MLQKSPSSFIFHFPSSIMSFHIKYMAHREEKKARIYPDKQIEEGQLPPVQLGPGVSVPAMHEHSHSLALVCGGGCAVVAVGTNCWQHSAGTGSFSQEWIFPNHSFRVVIFSCSGVILFFSPYKTQAEIC